MLFGLVRAARVRDALLLNWLENQNREENSMEKYEMENHFRSFCRTNAGVLTDEEQGAQAYGPLSYMMNIMGNSQMVNGFIDRVMQDHRYLQQQFFSMLMKIVRRYATAFENRDFDGRNECACKTAHEIAKAMKDGSVTPWF
jgi:hypothetical protein